MKPEDFRQLLIKPGTALGLLGEEIGPGLVKGTLTSYVVVERHHNMYREVEEIVWDTAIILTLLIPLQIKTVDAKEYSGNRLLLIQRNPERAWDNSDPNVHVFGIPEGENLGEGPLARNVWQPKTVWLESHAIMTVENPEAPSETSRLMQKRTGQ